MSQATKLIIGFILLPVGVIITLLLPELGVPIILLSTRFLQVKYAWARTLNLWVDNNYIKVKIWFKSKFKK